MSFSANACAFEGNQFMFMLISMIRRDSESEFRRYGSSVGLRSDGRRSPPPPFLGFRGTHHRAIFQIKN